MSVLSRVNFVAQQRVDLHDFLAMESFTAFDFRALVSSFTGTNKAYVVRGFEVVGRSGLSIQIKTANSQIFNPQDGNGSFYVGLENDSDFSLILPSSQTNIFVEAKFKNQTGSPVSRGIWDAIALSGEDASGTEFGSSVNFENKIVLEITANTVGFSEGAIPLLRATTTSSEISTMIDCRPMMWRLGTGGTSPDPLHKYDFSTTRSEPVPSGTGVGDSVDSPWRSRDSIGAINDKAFKSFKDWADAVMTRFSEMSGSPIWYLNSLATAPAANISLNQTFFDTLGHSIQPSTTTSFKWKRNGGNFVLAGEGSISGVSPWSDGLIRWKANYNGLEWHLGNTFVSASDRNYTNLHFLSPSPASGGSVYLKLEREVPKGSGASVKWADNSAYGAFSPARAVSGNAGDFTGIAIGDYIRKQSEGYSRYYRVAKISGGSLGTTYDNISNQNKVADSTIIALLLENISDPSLDIVGGASNEPLRYFRSRYSSNDIFSDQTANIFSYQDADFYWLGRRFGEMFYLRGYGTLQENEEVTAIDATWSKGLSSGGGSGDGFDIEHAQEAVYDSSLGYKLKTGSGTLIVIRKQKRDNTVETPIPGSDNSAAVLSYSITSPIGLMSVGDQLWVRLSDNTGGALSSGSVTNSTDDTNNSDVNTNRWEIRSAANTPVQIYDNKDIYLLARRINVGSEACLLFSDGSILNSWGKYIQNNVEIAGNLKLTNKPDTAVLFIKDDGTKEVVTDVGNFYYNPTSGTFRARTFVITDNDIALSAPADVDLLSNLGSHTAKVGTSQSTIHIPGDLVVSGNTIAAQVSEIQTEDKLITLGIGTPVSDGNNAGIQVASTSIIATNIATTASSPDVVVTLASTPLTQGYVLGGIVGLSSADTIGGITAGQINGEYTLVSSLSAPGDVTISGTTATFRTAVSAVSTASAAPSETKIYRIGWSLLLSGSDGDSSVNSTSWRFAVQAVAEKPTLTPVLGYGIVPTAYTTDMVAGRIAFVGNDNMGPSGGDTTIETSANFSWNDATNQLTINGSLVGVNYQQWVHQSTLSVTWPPALSTKVFAGDDYFLYKRTPDGNLSSLAEAGNVYDELVDVVAVPSGNNQMAPIPSPPSPITLPKDTQAHLGTYLLATTAASSNIVSVKKYMHGLQTGDLITVVATTTIGGITGPNLSVVGSAVTVVDFETFTYVAGANASSNDTNQLDKVIATKDRYYYVGDKTLEVYLNGVLQRPGIDYSEVGTPGTTSNTISWLIPLVLDDEVSYRIDSNGGVVIVNNAGGTSLQASYNVGNVITTTTGNPFTINGPVSEKLFVVNGDIEVTGIIDPKGIQFSLEGATPFTNTQHGLWINSLGELIHHRSGDAPQNITNILTGGLPAPTTTASFLYSSGGTIAKGTPVSVNSSGAIVVTDPGTAANAEAIIGIVEDDINDGNSGSVLLSGRLMNFSTTELVGTPVYVDKAGELTGAYPTIGVDGFLSGDYVIRAGVVVKNILNPLNKDLIVSLQIVGTL